MSSPTSHDSTWSYAANTANRWSSWRRLSHKKKPPVINSQTVRSVTCCPEAAGRQEGSGCSNTDQQRNDDALSENGLLPLSSTASTTHSMNFDLWRYSQQSLERVRTPGPRDQLPAMTSGPQRHQSVCEAQVWRSGLCRRRAADGVKASASSSWSAQRFRQEGRPLRRASSTRLQRKHQLW